MRKFLRMLRLASGFLHLFQVWEFMRDRFDDGY